ncbi:CapA family protein [Geodermatophilus sp. DF01-2]|uniref:CapA family protein n=1 Tax=Geodermatophilus sp. DF01-2 TaxID=2559610 RepID=UPI0010733049|nr:CapA family protein [Geodermatophilus sp. DF01_2]TFV53263.1 CapA family protein [Geodermatophilus sp. DF01_2]
MSSNLRRTGTAVALALVLAGCGTAPDDPAAAPSTASAAEPPPESVTLVATGDVLVHQDGALEAGAATGGGGYDFSAVFAPVAPLLRDADLAICHLETPVAPAGGPHRGYPSFAVQPEVVDALAEAGYDLCSTASNHSLDDGAGGLARTLDALDAAGIAHTGTYRTEAESTTPVVVDAGGVRVGHVAATWSLNGVPLPAGRPWAVDVADVPDVDGMLAAAARARAAGAEIVVASLHCCTEYDHDPTTAQEEAARALLASPDVDLVLGHHAHVVQPFERIDGEWVAYGLGNHLAEHSTRGYPTEDSVAARFTFTRGDDGRFTVTRAEAVPLRIDRRPDAVQVVPADPATYERVAAVLDRRGAVADGLGVVPG